MSVLRLYSGISEPHVFWNTMPWCRTASSTRHLEERAQLYPGDGQTIEWNYSTNDTASYPRRQIFKSFDPHLANNEQDIFNAIHGICEDFLEFIGVF